MWAGIRSSHGSDVRLYANPAGLTGSSGLCVMASAAGSTSAQCPGGEPFSWWNRWNPVRPGTKPPPPPPLFKQLAEAFFCHSCRKVASHHPGFKNCKVYFFRCFTSMWKRAEVLHLCEIWNISSKYIKAQCLINVFRIRTGATPPGFFFFCLWPCCK